jgi:outer membrane protein TolC
MKTSCFLILIMFGVLRVDALAAQQPPAESLGPQVGSRPLDSLIARALEANPSIVAAERRVEAAGARVRPAGALDDPMLMLGLMNQPLGGQEEGMAMRVVGLSQMIPFPSKLRARRAIAEHELTAARADLVASRRAVVKDLEEAYYEIVFIDRSIEILGRNETLLGDFVRVTEVRYGAGTGGQPDVLNARLDLARLAEDAIALQEERRAALARLNALLDRPSSASVAAPAMPERVARAAVAAEPDRIRFTSAALGARAADSPLPALEILQEMMVTESPELLARDALIEAQRAQVTLAGTAYLPDVDFSLQYGQRSGLPDLVSAVVSLPIPVRRGSRQDLMVADGDATLASLRAERAATANELRAQMAGAHADLERARAQLALLVRSVLPLGHAALESATASFEAGRGDLLNFLEAQAALLGFETAYHRALTDFAIGLAEIERLVGKEIL